MSGLATKILLLLLCTYVFSLSISFPQLARVIWQPRFFYFWVSTIYTYVFSQQPIVARSTNELAT